MKKVLGILLIAYTQIACQEMTPLQSSNDANCQAPPIEQNIVGTWHFASTYAPFSLTKSTSVTQGNVTFREDKTILDPDSLFSIQFVGPSVQLTTYEVDTTLLTPGGNFGRVFAVYLHGARGTQVDAFRVSTNTCHQIQLLPANSTDDKSGITLTKI